MDVTRTAFRVPRRTLCGIYPAMVVGIVGLCWAFFALIVHLFGDPPVPSWLEVGTAAGASGGGFLLSWILGEVAAEPARLAMTAAIARSAESGLSRKVEADARDEVMLVERGTRVRCYEFRRDWPHSVLIETTLGYDEIERVDITILPKELQVQSSDHKFTLGGLLVGGPGGLVVGAVVDSILGSFREQQVRFLLRVNFSLKDGQVYYFDALNRGYSIAGDEVKRLPSLVQSMAAKMQELVAATEEALGHPVQVAAFPPLPKVSCKKCGVSILITTSNATGGLCRPCAQGRRRTSGGRSLP